MLYEGAYNILSRWHGDQTTRNMETLEALAEHDYEDANEVEIAQTGTPSVPLAETLDRKKPSLCRIEHEHFGGCG